MERANWKFVENEDDIIERRLPQQQMPRQIILLEIYANFVCQFG